MPAPARSTERDSSQTVAAASATTCLVLHAHQPPNIPDAEIERLVRCIYQPLLAIHAACAAPLTLNVQGCLLRRLNGIAADFVEQLRELVRGGLVELTTSAHYHPCLPLLSRNSRKRQLALNMSTIEEILDVQPHGFWPPELAWSPALCEQLVEAGIRWTIVDGSACVHAWSVEEAPTPSALYLDAELMRPYALACFGTLIAVPRQHDWSRLLLEEDASVRSHQLDAHVEALRSRARGLICLATDAERITSEGLRGYERLLRSLSEFSRLSTITPALERHPATQAIDMPIWTWLGPLDRWVRGEGERSFLRELDDAYRRRACLAGRLQDADLAAVDDSLMRAECSCWLFWRAPYRFLAEGFAQIERANRIMDPT